MSDVVLYLLENGDTYFHYAGRKMSSVLADRIDTILAEGTLMEVVKYLSEQLMAVI